MRGILLFGCITLAGCGSTVTGYNAEGKPVSVKVGFGNRIQTKDYTVEPAETVVNSAERVSIYAIQTAPEAIVRASQNRTE